VVANLLHGADGKWSAVDAKQIYRHALTASYVYHASLRAQLTARLGVDWTPPTKGVAEIDGTPADLLGTFSTRRRQILAAMTAAGTTGPDAAQAACLATRPAKPGSEPEQSRRDRWAATARAAGHHPGRLIAAVLGRRRPSPVPPVHQLAAYLLGPAGLTAQATGFDRRDLLQALCQALPAGTVVDRAAIETAADQVLASRDVVRLVSGVEDGPRWTTTELLRVEQAALHIAGDLQAQPDREVASEVVAGRKLSAEQQAMVRALTAADGLSVVVGPAGAGKTAALAAAAQAWTAQGRPVTGAVAAVTARRLEHATGITATSLTRILNKARRTDPVSRRPAGLARGGVLVVDEASMVDTRTLAHLLQHTRAADATLVLVGDPAQLPKVGAGGLFTALARHPDTITLTDNRRQTEPWERRALADLRAGDPDAAVAAYAEHGRVHTAPADQLADRVVTDYLHHLQTPDSAATEEKSGTGPRRVVMLAVRRRDVVDLNDITRARLIATRRLGADAVTAGHGDAAREYRAGDQVMVTANDHQLGLLNGTHATVTTVDQRRRTLTLAAAEDDRPVVVDADWAHRHLDHGYAMTCHKAQGATVDVALLYGTAALSREAGNVALSRGRTANHLYVPDHTDQRGADAGDGYLDDLAARLSQRRTQTLATRQLPRTRPGAWAPTTSTDRALRRAEGMSR
jgi:AAA domain/TrwC relaxase